MERKEIIDELFPWLPKEKPKEEKPLFCGGCKYFPFSGKQKERCRKVYWTVNATDNACCHYKRRPRKRASKAAQQTILPRQMWKPCEECGRWLKTAASIQEGVGHGCKRKKERMKD
ncbi:DUF6011 domain-containing protein [Aneurinibacillus migulanus]|uniref:Uncharacterized protein n=1 Tax=Aneurinibacillus migulanus TaxID=47500 RepID=A0A0D1VL74_ANEMI|nr:DUF6011 domain-containing protein [Aneurinibacillus migulanus]KIV60309.1 hypothetical protein TS65_00570 [Aneurinibacillus migulanus]KON90493.1 hypothetical protein AF333_28840 [Aneurinibacillus migulanus]MED0894933.1 hypothetical protein [Aneurinibacillus migulanus]MED1614424.1 hypothetical protein [Aneurinibacillus migulanus]SDJ78134.1 hypothetical protein SAMN04487909_12864 [Aneurinibacillus migulanus]